MRMLSLLLVLFAQGLGAAEPALRPELAGFQPFLGKTFRGDLGDAKAGTPKIDVQHWERALNGQAVRNLHSINDGEYGGESIIFWDPKAKQVRYWYFTTAGFWTEGTMTLEGKSYTAHETVTGDSDGVTEVKSTGTLHDDGTYRTESQYLQGGAWKPGHSGTYTEAPDARVNFR